MPEAQSEQTNKPVEPVKERSNMVRARRAMYLTQKALAKKMNVSHESIVNWEKAHTTPQLYQIPEIIEYIKFPGTDEELRQVFIVESPVEATHLSE